MEEIEQFNINDLQPMPSEQHDELFSHCVDEVALNLIGMFISNEVGGSRVGGQIIETEAYCLHDPAAHCHSAAKGQIRYSGSEPMSRAGGHIYVYPSRLNDLKGTWCLNLTCGPNNFGSAVLIRALRPTLDSIKSMKNTRREFGPKVLTQLNLCNGPGSLHEALGLLGDNYNGARISSTPIRLYARPPGNFTVKCGRRFGIRVTNAAAEWPRSYILDDPAAAKFLSPGAMKINRTFGREPAPSSMLQQLKTTGPLASCKCSSAIR